MTNTITRSEAASDVAAGTASIFALFSQIILLFAGLGGIVASFLNGGIVAAIIYGIAWLLIGGFIWQVGLTILAILVTGVAYGIVYLIFPNNWPAPLRWILVIPAAVGGALLATVANVIARLV